MPGSGWTAYFDNGLRGTDPAPIVSYLVGVLRTPGVAVTAVPHTVGRPGIRHGRYGVVKFELFGPEAANPLHELRSVVKAYDGNRWVFEEFGDPQPFESCAAYRQRNRRDRFTSEMLAHYCTAVGLPAFHADAYGPRSILVATSVAPAPEAASMALAEARSWLEIGPGDTESPD